MKGAKLATHTVSCTQQKMYGDSGQAVTLTIDIGLGDSVTTLIRFFAYKEFLTIEETVARANKEAYDLFYALAHSDLNLTRFASEDQKVKARVALSHGHDAVVRIPEEVGRYFATQVIS